MLQNLQEGNFYIMNGYFYKTDVVELKKLMVENNIESVSELSKMCNINRSTLSKILNEELQPTSQIMYKLAECLNMSSVQAGKIFFSIEYLNDGLYPFQEDNLSKC